MDIIYNIQKLVVKYCTVQAISGTNMINSAYFLRTGCQDREYIYKNPLQNILIPQTPPAAQTTIPYYSTQYIV